MGFYRYLALASSLLERIELETDWALSPVSALEIGIRQRKGKLLGVLPIQRWLSVATQDFRILPISPLVAAETDSDPWFNPDPDDRLLVWTSKIYNDEWIHTDVEVARLQDILLQSYFPR